MSPQVLVRNKNAGETEKEDSSNETDDEEFNPTLAAMESEIKPKVLKQLVYSQKNIIN